MRIAGGPRPSAPGPDHLAPRLFTQPRTRHASKFGRKTTPSLDWEGVLSLISLPRCWRVAPTRRCVGTACAFQSGLSASSDVTCEANCGEAAPKSLLTRPNENDRYCSNTLRRPQLPERAKRSLSANDKRLGHRRKLLRGLRTGRHVVRLRLLPVKVSGGRNS